LLHGCLRQNCDAYLDELQDALHTIHGITTSLSTIWRALRRSGLSMKKVCWSFLLHIHSSNNYKLTRVAAERSAIKRAEYVARIGFYSREQLVFVDESAADRRTTYRGRAWAIRGQRALRKACFVQGQR